MYPGWVMPWIRAFSPGSERLLCVRRAAELRGLQPLLQRRGMLRSPTNWHTPLLGCLARDNEARAELARAFIEAARTGVDLAFLDRDDPTLDMYLREARARGWPALVRPVAHSPYVDLSATDWERFCATLDNKLRKEVRRLRRRLDERGAVTVEFAGGSGDLEARLEEGFSIEGSGWKDRAGTAIVSDPRTRQFYTEVARWAASCGALSMAFLRLNGQPIAFDLGLEWEGAVYVLKGGFDPRFRRYGPGTLLTYESLRRAFEDGMSSYELLGDADPYKLVWTRTVRERMRFQAFNMATAGGAARWLAWTQARPRLLSLRDTIRAATHRPRR